MDWKQFISNIIGSLAWPVAIVSILALFRVQVRHLLTQVRKIGAGGVNVELAEQVEKVRDQAEAVEVEQGAPGSDIITLDPAILQLAQRHPEAAVLQTFKELEGVILLIRSHLPDKRPHRTLNEVLKYLNDKGFISGSVLALFQSLREARNAVAHSADRQMATGEAIELIRQTRLLIDLLQRVDATLLKAPNPPKNERI